MFICNKCGNAFSEYTKTKAGKPRYYCRPCGIKPFVPPELKKQNESPPCPNPECEYLGKNYKVQKLQIIKKTGKRRYKCTNCNKSFMQPQDYTFQRIDENIKLVKSPIPKNDWENITREWVTRMNIASLREFKIRSSTDRSLR